MYPKQDNGFVKRATKRITSDSMPQKKPVAFKCLGMKQAMNSPDGCYGCRIAVPRTAYTPPDRFLVDVVIKTPDRCVYGSCVKDDVVWISVF